MTTLEAKPPVVEVRCVSHLGITVDDLQVAIDFYTRVLGFERLFEDKHESWTRVGLGLADIQIELFSPFPRDVASAGDVDPYYPAALGHPKIALTAADLDKAYHDLVAAGITPVTPIVETPMSRFFILTDPDGTTIQLHQFTGGQLRVTDLLRTFD